MTAPKILNLDAYASVKRQLTFKGKTYDVNEPSVQDFVDALKAQEELDKQGTAPESNARNVESAIASILRAIPGFPENELRKLPLEALSPLLQFVRGEDDTPKAEGESGEAKNAS